MSEMSFEEAVQELGDAVEADAGASEVIPEAPVAEQSEAVESAPGVAPEVEGAAPVSDDQVSSEQVDTFDGGKFNPDTLPEELRPGWAQLQAEWTRKTQALAQERKQFEELGGIEQIRQANELYTRLQDPENWVALHTELTAELQRAGRLSPAEASAQATAALEQAATPPAAAPSSLDSLEESDPELAPLIAELKANRARLEAFEAQQAEAAQAAEEQREYMALVSELQNQENVIRDMRTGDGTPVYTQQDIDEMYVISSFHNGDLLEAQRAFEGMRARWAEGYLAQKAAVNVNTPQPIGGGGAVTSPAPEGAADLDEAEKRAMEELRVAGLADTAL